MFTYKRDLQKWLDFWAGEGYTTDPNNSPTDSGLIELKKMSKPASESEEPFCEARVRLWSVHCPVEAFFKSIRMSFEATVVTWDKMYTLFPHQTLVSGYACMIGEMLDSHGQVMAYQKWPASRIAGDYDHAPVEDFFQTQGQRRHIGDVETFTLQLDTQGIQQPGSVFRIELCEFWFGLSDDYDRECCMIDTETIENNPMFRFGYTVYPRYRENDGADDGTPLTLIKDEYLPNLFALQVLSLPKDQRPPNIVVSQTQGGRSGVWLDYDFLWSDLKDWKPPAGCDWELIDGLLPGWIRNLHKKGETRHGYDVLPFGPQDRTEGK